MLLRLKRNLITFRGGGLPPLFTFFSLPEYDDKEDLSKNMNTEENRLSSARQGEICTVSMLLARGFVRRRFYDLGICEGAHIRCIGKSPFGDPLLFLVRGKMIAIRGNDARLIAIKRE